MDGQLAVPGELHLHPILDVLPTPLAVMDLADVPGDPPTAGLFRGPVPDHEEFSDDEWVDPELLAMDAN